MQTVDVIATFLKNKEKLMKETSRLSAAILGLFILAGLFCLGWLLAHAAIEYKGFERYVSVKGLSEREYEADIVIWPVQFRMAGNNLAELYNSIEENTVLIIQFLESRGINSGEVTVSPPSIQDRSTEGYRADSQPVFRFAASQVVTVYSENIPAVRKAMSELSELGKKGIAFYDHDYGLQTEYLFTKLNNVKPEMIEEATKNAREVAEKFAADSKSRLGKIKSATQGQFSIYSRDQNNPQIKKVRVVSTVEYYLSD